MKKFITVFVFIVLLSCCVTLGFSNNNDYAFAEEMTTTLNLDNFIQSNNLDNIEYNIKELKDFSDKRFVLFEFEDVGYAIYTKETNQFIEGSAKNKSPYYDYANDLYYLGPFSYFVLDNNRLYNIIENKYELVDDYQNATYSINENIAEESANKAVSRSSHIPGDLTIDDMTLIDDHFYFENCNYPSNDDGTCAITAIGIILGYYDNYHNDDFVSKEYSYQFEYYSNSLNDVSAWEPEGRGTNDDFGTLLFKNYKDYIDLPLVDEEEDGYPMGEVEIKNTIQNYLAEETPISSNNIIHHSGSLFYTHQKPRELLQNDIPVILVLSKYDYQKDTMSSNSVSTYGNYVQNGIINPEDYAWHTVVAYGYNEQYDTFLVNYGWGSSYNSIILSNYTCYAYYALEYTGEHKHSENAMGYHRYSFWGANYKASYACCGCGASMFKTLVQE